MINKMSKRSIIPAGAKNIELFFMRKDENGKCEAFIGFRTGENNDFNYLQIGIDDDLKTLINENRIKL